jgi:hypothetical protein
LKNKGLGDEMMTKIGLYDIVKATTPESNKSVAPIKELAERDLRSARNQDERIICERRLIENHLSLFHVVMQARYTLLAS